MMIKMSEHATNDRIERLTYIATEIGIGEPVLSYLDETTYRLVILTDTGVVVIENSYTEELVTAYVASLDRACAMWKRIHGTRILPNTLYKRILRNKSAHYQEVNEINKSYGYKYKNGKIR